MNSNFSRRTFINQAAVASLAALARPALLAGAEPEPATAPRKMKLALSPGAIGVKASARECILLAQKYGFEAVEPNTGFLTGLSETEVAQLRADLQTKGLVFGAAGLSVEFRGDEGKFRSSLEALPRSSAALKRAGVERIGTWINPGYNDATYVENFRLHARRLREVAKVLQDQGQRLGLEYVGTPSARRGRRYQFIHSMREMRELISEIGLPNTGLVLDSWHWWTSGETEADLLALKPTDVVSVDLNDAPKNLSLDEQQDGKRELPCATGVIPLGAFLSALNHIGYDGPVRAEPFNKPLNDLDDEPACAAVIAALHKAMALVK